MTREAEEASEEAVGDADGRGQRATGEADVGGKRPADAPSDASGGPDGESAAGTSDAGEATGGTADAGVEATDGTRTGPGGEEPSPFREGVRKGRAALAAFVRGFRDASEQAPVLSRAAAALTTGVGLSYAYEYVVVVVAALTDRSPAAVGEALTVEVSTQALLLFLLVLVYVDLFLSTVALRRARRTRPPEPTGFEGEPRRSARTGADVSRGWWAVNLVLGAAAGYMLLAGFGPLVAGLGASIGLLGGDELFRRVRGR